MALEYATLASGSSGNSLWIRGGGVELLVDAGLHFKELTRRLAAIGRSPVDLAAVIVTHGHGDHTGGVGTLARRTDARIVCPAETFAEIPFDPPAEAHRKVARGGSVQLGGLTITTIPTPHDAAAPIALTIDDGESRLGYATDLGCVTAAVEEGLAGCDGLVLELNHDERMLREGPYPERLKQRILSRHGHLSNEAGAALLAAVAHGRLQHVTLAHLSETNNRPKLAQAAAEAALARVAFEPRLVLATQRAPGEPVTLRPGGRLGQLRLPLG